MSACSVMMAVWVALALGLLCVRVWVCIIKRAVSNERKRRIVSRRNGVDTHNTG